jgi:hypothetical protein
MIDSGTLHRFALDCAEKRYFHLCQYACTTCPSNISLYGLDKRDAVAIQHRANLDFNAWADAEMMFRKKEARKNRVSRIGGLVFLALFLAWAVWSAFLFLAPDPPPEAEPPGASEAREALEPFDLLSIIAPTVETLERVYKADIDGDGVVNCIDYAIQFYNAYPDREAVRLVVNYNPTKEWNHLFVTVWGVAIEPVSLLRRKQGNPIGVMDYWGDTYDPRYNKDVTPYVGQIRIGGYWGRQARHWD